MTTVYGYIRFSFFGRNDTRIARRIQDEEQRFKVLYDPKRMEERFYLFENITLPSIKAQSDQDFKVLVVSSTVMPEEYKRRLNKAVADIPQVEVVYSDAEHITHELNPRIADMTAGISQKTVHFRLDDDDAICADTVKTLRWTKRHARNNELISFPRGLYLSMVDGEPKIIRKFAPYIAIAWAYVNLPGQVRNPYQGIHNQAHWHIPSMLDPRPWVYIHVAHESQDSKIKQSQKLEGAEAFDPSYDTPEARAEIDQIVREHFPSFTGDGLRDIIASAPGQKKRLLDPQRLLAAG